MGKVVYRKVVTITVEERSDHYDVFIEFFPNAAGVLSELYPSEAKSVREAVIEALERIKEYLLLEF